MAPNIGQRVEIFKPDDPMHGCTGRVVEKIEEYYVVDFGDIKDLYLPSELRKSYGI